MKNKITSRDFPLSPTPEPTPIRILSSGERLAKRGSILKVKSKYKLAAGEAKQNFEGFSKRTVRGMVKDAKKDYKEAKKEIRNYPDYLF